MINGYFCQLMVGIKELKDKIDYPDEIKNI